MTALLDVVDLHVSFDSEDGVVDAVRGISFDVRAGETLGIVGESGSGKSVSTQAIVRLLRGATVTGRADFDGIDLLRASAAELRRIRGTRIAMVFQDPLSSLHPQYKVGWQIAEGIRAHHRMSRSAARQRSIELLDEVGIPQPDRRVDDYPHQFSGGMRQRAMLAIALARRPELLIADEPTTALDVTVQAQLLELMARLQREHGTAIVMITHDLGVISRIADRVLTMYAGRVVERGTRDQLFDDPRHPYTRGLLASVPGTATRGGRLIPIDGQPPSMLRLAPGCSFAPRCPQAIDDCRAATPPDVTISAEHQAACIFAGTVPGSVAQSATGDGPAPDVLTVPGSVPTVTTSPLVRLREVVKHFDGPRHGMLRRTELPVRAVDGIDLDVLPGETLAIVGESGSGKSTLARLVNGLIPATAGTIEVDGRTLGTLDASGLKALRREVQMVFQDPYGSLNPRRRVGSIIADPMVIHGSTGAAEAGLRAAGKAEVKARVQELMRLVGLNPEHYNRFPAEFSGGQRQRIGVARALALNPKLIICDEPVSALDVSIQAQIVNLLADLQGEFDLTYIVIAHDLGVVEHIADRVAVMYLGRIVEIGTADELFAAPRHPYTKALVDAAPRIDDHVATQLLEGDVPSPINPPSGCHFHPRCPVRRDDCATVEPPLEAVGDSERLAACRYPLIPVEVES